mmetsp:Transcript_15672/g.61220  ORF Transcript_15672/g.61220 Transcript_15672/m.61220 type:complete len:234 (+) Transcript_15672:1065-1766(+)
MDGATACERQRRSNEAIWLLDVEQDGQLVLDVVDNEEVVDDVDTNVPSGWHVHDDRGRHVVPAQLVEMDLVCGRVVVDAENPVVHPAHDHVVLLYGDALSVRGHVRHLELGYLRDRAALEVEAVHHVASRACGKQQQLRRIDKPVSGCLVLAQEAEVLGLGVLVQLEAIGGDEDQCLRACPEELEDCGVRPLAGLCKECMVREIEELNLSLGTLHRQVVVVQRELDAWRVDCE